ncbi:hypothetical protein E2320_010122, partial [Naja naja]
MQACSGCLEILNLLWIKNTSAVLYPCRMIARQQVLINQGCYDCVPQNMGSHGKLLYKTLKQGYEMLSEMSPESRLYQMMLPTELFKNTLQRQSLPHSLEYASGVGPTLTSFTVKTDAEIPDLLVDAHTAWLWPHLSDFLSE